ncbi:cupin-like domain-containing protein [Nocardiopsis sp. NPDC049922]|uniref:cupin-like domain-containing protein n=1 Tax=Nocardiopsis sp. NPDC049922 TaxID=3155157 RepID=UPI0033FA072B
MADINARHGEVDVRSDISTAEFYREYVNRRPVLMKGALAEMPAVAKWSIPYFASIAPDLKVRLKTGNPADARTVTQTLREYSEYAADIPDGGPVDGRPPSYLHDLPLLSMIPGLLEDLSPFPSYLLTPFFRKQWWTFPQFFVGPAGAVTPLHFDTLQTHNLFFQFHGSKRFLIVDPEDRPYCYTYKWRWSHVDAEHPDYDRHPLYRKAHVSECVVEAGDLLYMPPGALHHVRSLSSSVSFNVDWHDRRSAIRGLTAVAQGMPRQNLRYNALFALGVCFGIPLTVMMPALKSYFYYIS